MSHHRTHNVFHDHDFGANVNNIHFATPGECLHMHQLGVAKRTVESIRGTVGKDNNKFEAIARKLGGALSCNSDRCFPRTRFGTNTDVLNPNMKEGKDYAGMLLCHLLAFLSVKGKTVSKKDNNFILHQVWFIELVLGMEEFLKHGVMTLSRLDWLRKTVRYFLEQLTKHCSRTEGMGNNLIKNHLYLHLPDYIKRWGPPAGWDFAPSESHHKTEIKGPSKNTQRNSATLVAQTWKLKREKHILKRVSVVYKNVILDPSLPCLLYTSPSPRD